MEKFRPLPHAAAPILKPARIRQRCWQAMSRRGAIVFAGAVMYVGALTAGMASAATTVANASAFVNGTTVNESRAGNGESVIAGANQVLPSLYGDAFVNALSLSRTGYLGAVGSARSSGAAGGFQARASGSWTDSFTIRAGSQNEGTVGKFSGTVIVTGDLSIDQFLGRFYANATVGATVSFDGYSLGNGASLTASYEAPMVLTGVEAFSLIFDQVPFTFGQPIGVSNTLTVLADVNIIDTGATGRSFAGYGQTMRWGGLNAVTDAANNSLGRSEYSAISDSTGFDFAREVPEPESATLLALGLLVVSRLSRRRCSFR